MPTNPSAEQLDTAFAHAEAAYAENDYAAVARDWFEAGAVWAIANLATPKGEPDMTNKSAEQIERLKFDLRQAIIDYESALVRGDQEAIRETTTRSAELIEALAEAPVLAAQPVAWHPEVLALSYADELSLLLEDEDLDEDKLLAASNDLMPRLHDFLRTFVEISRRAAPASGLVPVPQGWVVVPVEPTKEMCAAAVKLINGDAVYKNVAAGALEIEEGIYGEVYEAMLAAAPAAAPLSSPEAP